MQHVFNTLVFMAIGLIAFIWTQTFAGQIEGRVAPVVGDVRIFDVEAVGDTRSRIRGTFHKRRECDFVNLEFFLGTPNNAARVDLVLEEASKQRGEGLEEFGPWLVQLDAEQLTGRAFATAYHQCYIVRMTGIGAIPTPWITETRFYP